MTSERKLISTISAGEHRFEQLDELSGAGESLEVAIPGIDRARPRAGASIWQRFAEFLPFEGMDASVSLGEGDTPLLEASGRLKATTGVDGLLLKNETANPTWSFKDRGSLTSMFMTREMGERVTATVSSGNMGHSVAAYAARSGVAAIVFVPHFTPTEKLLAMGMHGATAIKVHAPEYWMIKQPLLDLAKRLSLRLVSGNGPIRVEGYKLTAFEMFEQMGGAVPDFVAVPTSACGHIRGLFKGYRELFAAGLVDRLPRMIVVQAAANSPIASAIKQGSRHVIPFSGFHTVAEAITTGNPMGGDEIIAKAYEHGWLAEDATEEEILEAQRELARDGLFVEPASATALPAVRKLRAAGRIAAGDTVVLMLTGTGLKDTGVLSHHAMEIVETTLDTVGSRLEAILARA